MGRTDGNFPIADQLIFDSEDYLIAKDNNKLIYYDKIYKEIARRESIKPGKEKELLRIIRSVREILSKKSFPILDILRLLDNGKEFEVFSAVVENPALHKSAQVFIGENGVQYYDLDFTK